jgi:hypothetical protein
MVRECKSDVDAAEWNRRLVDTFFSAISTQTPVRIITATDRQLATVLGLPADSETAARRSFVRAVRAVPYGVRKNFDYDFQIRLWQKQGGSPTFFSQLYLSLLAASATEDTHDEGDFRRRYCLLLNLAPGDYVSNGLPKLWEAFARWSEEESRSGKRIRRLVLPDPGYERIIGYSKRLAFPGFRDLSRLATLLSMQNLSADSPLQAILDGLQPRLASFSSSFRSEFDHLRRARDETPDSVVLLPLWAAVEAASFEPRGRSAKRRTRYALELSADEYGRPVAFLFTDTAPANLATALVTRPALHPIGDCSLEIHLRHATAVQGVLTQVLDPSHPLRRLLDGSLMRRQLEQGCLVFAPDEDVSWLWRASLPPAGPVHFLCSDNARKQLLRAITRIANYFPADERVEGVKGWSIVGLTDCQRLADELGAFDELSQYDALCPGVTSPRLTIRRAVEVPGGGILLTTASRPEVIAIGCDQVTLGASYEAGSLVQMGPLEPMPFSGGFRPTLAQVRGLRLPALISLRAFRGDDLFASREVHVTGSVPDSPLMLQVDRKAFLEESPSGQLTAPEAASDNDTEWLANPALEQALAHASQGISDVHTLSPAPTDPNQEARQLWIDLLEALTGAFTMAHSITDERLQYLTEGLRTAQPEYTEFGISTHLWHSMLVSKLWHRRWRGARWFPVLPSLSFDSELGSLRLLGLTSRRLRARFRVVTGQPGSDVAGFSPPAPLQVAGIDERTAKQFATALGVPLVDPPQPHLDSLAELLGRLPARYRAGRKGLHTSIWSPSAARFLEKCDPGVPVLLRRTDFERLQSIYEIMSEGNPIWATESRAWALFVYQCLSGGQAIAVRDSSVVTARPLPITFALAAAGTGGGTEVSPKHRVEQWRYRFGSRKALHEFLSSWLPKSETPSIALRRWAMLRSTERVQLIRGLAFARRYTKGNVHQ